MWRLSEAQACCQSGKRNEVTGRDKNKEQEMDEMKIAIPVDENKDMVCAVLGRAPYFLIYDTRTDTKDIRENPAAQAEGGAGLKAAQFIVDSQAEVLITPRCGQNSAEVFKEARIQIYKSEGQSVDDNLTAYKDAKLSALEKFHSGYHGIR